MEPQCFDLTLPERHKCGSPPALVNGYILVSRRDFVSFFTLHFKTVCFLNIQSVFRGVLCHIEEVIWNFTQDPKDIYIVGSKVEYTCTGGFYLTGYNSVECTENRSWSGGPGYCLSE